MVESFQSECLFCSFLNVKEPLAPNTRYLNFKLKATPWKYSRSNIAQTSSPCYVAGFRTPTLMRMCAAKEV